MRNRKQHIIGRDLAPYQEIVSYFENELNSMFNDPFFKNGHKMMRQKRTFPKVNVTEDDEHYTVQVALPGFDKKNIKLILEESKLTIESKTVKEKNETNESFLLREISARNFCRTIPFPTLVKLDTASSKFENGILEVQLDKVIEEKKEEVEIEVK